MSAWHESKFTGFFRDFSPVTLRPHDPQVSVWAATVPHWYPQQAGELHVGGCGWTDEAAINACVGEGIERLFAYPAEHDATIEAGCEDWPLDEPAIAPESWVLFHPQQYASEGFPFEPLTRRTRCRWICFREALSGEPRWIPEEFGHLLPRAGDQHRYCPATSTGLSAGTAGHPVVLRALQEVIERDALLGAWWGKYPVEEFPPEAAWDTEQSFRLQRPNLRWHFFRIESPFSNHVTMVTVEGEDREGFCHSVGSACRETLRASWNKSILEAVQGRHYVRHLRQQLGADVLRPPLKDFSDHAAYYSFHPEKLGQTVFHRAKPAAKKMESPDESLTVLCGRLGEKFPVLVRNMTPPILVGTGLDWRVVKVVVPGLQPLHGDDHFAHLGGPQWGSRSLQEWNTTPPHPFP